MVVGGAKKLKKHALKNYGDPFKFFLKSIRVRDRLSLDQKNVNLKVKIEQGWIAAKPRSVFSTDCYCH
jgi:hypothetical protein